MNLYIIIIVTQRDGFRKIPYMILKSQLKKRTLSILKICEVSQLQNVFNAWRWTTWPKQLAYTDEANKGFIVRQYWYVTPERDEFDKKKVQ